MQLCIPSKTPLSHEKHVVSRRAALRLAHFGGTVVEGTCIGGMPGSVIVVIDITAASLFAGVIVGGTGRLFGGGYSHNVPFNVDPVGHTAVAGTVFIISGKEGFGTQRFPIIK